MSQGGYNIKGAPAYHLHVDTLINVYHKEEVISSACAIELYLNRQSCSTYFFVQGFWWRSNVNGKPLPNDMY